MNLKTCLVILNVIVWVVVFGCSNTAQIQTPEKIGEKDRLNLITGAKATAVVNKLHGSTVTTGGDVIAEYGRGKKDLLYITDYTDRGKAKKFFNLMIEKMRAANARRPNRWEAKKYGAGIVNAWKLLKANPNSVRKDSVGDYSDFKKRKRRAAEDNLTEVEQMFEQLKAF